MRPGWIVPPLTQAKQALASDPQLSAWVSANAGSGKTHVLVNRVLRLLLSDVAPGRMLCITYTKAAAANMANRIFRALADWARMPDETLTRALADLTGATPSPERRAKARRLFAQALETPGGLKIETIHAFSTRVLQAAPFEANVPPRFEIADDLAQAQMLREARRELLAAVLADPEGEEARALGLLARQAAQDTFDAMIQEALSRRELFGDTDGRARDPGAMRRGMAEFLGVAPELTAAEVQGRFQLDLSLNTALPRLIQALEAGSATRQSFAAALRAALAGEDDPVAVCRKGLITEANGINQNIRGKGKSEFEPELLAVLDELAALVLAARDRLNAIAIRDRSHALAVLVTQMLASYRRLKSRRSLLDYDDLIAKTRSLLSRVDAAWVLYKLDAGIDHILLDEAQDTSTAQWAILGRLTDEFTSGAGIPQNGLLTRTVFAVGDEKQSIYGFQGAAPAAFGEERVRLGQRLKDANRPFKPVSLNTSFRSAREIMQAVDAVFALPDHARGLVFDGAGGPEPHDTVRQGARGCVDLWPLSLDDAGEKPDAWTAPVDALSRRSGVAKLAGRIATTLARWQRAGRDDLGNAFSPGDVMILLRNRGALFETIVKALKDAGVPVTGRDRLTLADHPAVEDMLALARAILLPDDDLALATALKTPLLNLDDDDLLRLAPGRPGSLRAALAQAAQSEPRYRAVETKLTGMTREAGRCGPFRFFAKLLGPDSGRNLALARLGPESGDALDAFLNAALDHERRYGPSLAGFIRHVGGAAADVKRDLSASAGEVRVMTVHGAKGLEAKVVILADLAPPPGAKRLPKILVVQPPQGEPVPLWPTAGAEDASATRRAKARAIEHMVEEHHRLLYVAMTRAEDRLIVCGAQKQGEAPDGSWYAMIAAGLAASDAGLHEARAPDGEGMIARFMTSAPQPPAPAVGTQAAPAASPPAWLARPAPREDEPAPPLKPSNALSAADAAERPGDGPFLAESAAAGRLAHLLLQMLPEIAPERRAETAQTLAGVRGKGLSGARRDRLVADVLKLLDEPGLFALFAEGSLAEVPVAGAITLPGGAVRAVSGQIDRLVITPDEVVIADFKTATRPPADLDAMPPGTLAQLAVYRALIGAIYPGRRVRALAIYTATLSVLEPEAGRLDAVLVEMAG